MSAANQYRRHDCWICKAGFGSRPALKNHLMSPPHNALRVVCMWCFSEERNFRRTCDLYIHVQKYHSMETEKLPLGFFSESNGYWFAVSPKLYKTVTHPTGDQTEIAWLGRTWIRRWLERCRRTTKRRSEWESGWASPQKHPRTPERHPGMEDVRNQTVEYDPVRPSIIERLFIATIAIEDPIKILCWSEAKATTRWYQIEVTAQSMSDGKTMFALSRRQQMDASRQKPVGRPTTAGTPCPEKRDAIATSIGINPVVITAVIHWTVDLFGTGKTKSPTVESSLITSSTRTPSSTIPPYLPITSGTGQRENHSPESHTNVEIDVFDENMSIFDEEGTEKPKEEQTEISSRATELLRNGCLPLFPSSRRAWDEDEQVTLPMAIRWPPKGWKEMTADVMLLQWEHAAFSLSQKCEHAVTNRILMLEDFNMLALPGTAVPTISSNVDETTHTFAKAHYYNYLILLEIATGKNKENAEAILVMFESARVNRDKTLDHVIERVEIGNIPLRLE